MIADTLNASFTPAITHPHRGHFPAPSSDSRSEARRDRLLVSRYNAGDASAFVEIVRHYRGKIFNLTQLFLRNEADAEEVTQDTFIRAHRALAGFRGDSSLATWLHRIAVNLARNRYWYHHRRRRHTTLSLDRSRDDGGAAQLKDCVAATAPDPARCAIMDEFTSLVAACLQQLDPDQREILTQRIVSHKSYHEISATLGLRVGTVKSRIARAREELRALLAERCHLAGCSLVEIEHSRTTGDLKLD